MKHHVVEEKGIKHRAGKRGGKIGRERGMKTGKLGGKKVEPDFDY